MVAFPSNSKYQPRPHPRPDGSDGPPRPYPHVRPDDTSIGYALLVVAVAFVIAGLAMVGAAALALGVFW